MDDLLSNDDPLSNSDPPPNRDTAVPTSDRTPGKWRRMMAENGRPSCERLEGLTPTLPLAFGGQKRSERKKNNKSPRPNYFVSIPVTSAQVRAAVAEIQEAVLRREPRLAGAMIPAASLHITLLVAHLADPGQVDAAAAALAHLEPQLGELLGGVGIGQDLVLPFSGIGHFGQGEVVFVGLEEGPARDALRGLAAALRSRFEERGLVPSGGGGDRGFEPHLTIMKLSRAPRLRAQGLWRIDPELYSRHAAAASGRFGEQTVARLDLCSMLKRKQEDGYYHTESLLRIDGRRGGLGQRKAGLPSVSGRMVEDQSSGVAAVQTGNI